MGFLLENFSYIAKVLQSEKEPCCAEKSTQGLCVHHRLVAKDNVLPASCALYTFDIGLPSPNSWEGAAQGGMRKRVASAMAG